MSISRRNFLGTGAAASVAAMSGSAFAADKIEHYVDGGMALGGHVARSRFVLTGMNGSDAHGIPKIDMPGAGLNCPVYLLPLTKNQRFGAFQESADVTLLPNGQVQVNTTGMYRVSMCLDWPGQENVDHDLRYYCVGRSLAGVAAMPFVAGQLTDTAATTFDRLASLDLPGSDAPGTSRAVLAWNPGVVPANGFVHIDVAMPNKGLLVVGDVAQVAHTSLNDTTLGMTNDLALDILGKVIAPDVVRVVIRNMSAVPITVTHGNLNILGMSTITQRGNSADGWNSISSATEMLMAGELVFGVFKSYMPGDYLQCSGQSYLQVERWA